MLRESSQLLYLFPLVYLFIAFMSGFFTIGVSTVFAGYLTRLYTKKSLRSIAQYAQFIFPALFPVVWILLPRLPQSLSDGGIEKLTAVLKWFYALPNGWFAGAVSLALGENGTTISDFNRIGCRFNIASDMGSTSEYRAELFRVSLLLVGIGESTEI